MISYDRTGFPLVEIGPGLRVGLLPAARVQVEAFLGDTPQNTAANAKRFLRSGPRASWRSLRHETLERQFASELEAQDAERFAGWMGGRLPTAAEWRAGDTALAAVAEKPLREIIGNERAHPAAWALLEWLLRHRTGLPGTRAALLQDGLLEWVTLPDGGHGLLGRPRRALYSVILNPQRHDPVRPRPHTRHPAFGMRLVWTT